MIKLDNRGFTIVELMIATAVFSVVLVIMSVGLITIGRQYVKSDINITTQNASRTIMDEVALQVQLGAKAPNTSTSGVYCIGSVRYSYSIGFQVEDVNNAPKNQQLHALWRDIIPNENVCQPATLTAPDPSSSGVNNGVPGSGRELIPNHTRLVAFDINNNNGSVLSPYPDPRLWNINVSIIYGDDEIIFDTSDTLLSVSGRIDIIKNCAGINGGGAFCGLSELHTSVYRESN